MENRPVLITKKSGIVVSYHDAAIFYATKGNAVDKTQESYPDVPYGIILGHYNEVDALNLRFDEDELKVYLKPGIFQVYGRQVEITEEIEVFDFHTTVESTKMYCTVYAELDLEDYTNQIVKIKINIAGAGFYNLTANGEQNNLYELNHGVFQAPIARFTYVPSAETHFGNAQRIMPITDDESVNTARDFDITKAKFNNKRLNELLDVSGSTPKWFKADNTEALRNYLETPNHSTSTPGYCKAKEATAIGNNRIDQNLTGVFTIKSHELGAIGNLGSAGHSFDKTFDINRYKAAKIRFRLTGNFKAKMYKKSWVIFHWGDGGKLTEPEDGSGLYIEAPNLEQQYGMYTRLDPTIDKFYRRSPFDEWFNVPVTGGTIRLVFYYQHTVQWYTDTCYRDYWKFGIIEESKWGTISGNDDKWSTPTPPAGSATDKRRLAYIDLTCNSDYTLRVHMWSRGPLKWEGWEGILYCWDEVSEPTNYTNNDLKGFVDILYEGDIRL